VSAPVPVTSASASVALRTLLRGSDVEVAVLATFPRAVYLAVADVASRRHPDVPGVIALVTTDGIAHPNAVAVAALSTARPFADLREVDPGRVGGGRVHVGGLELRVRRWWDPRPALPAIAPARLRRSLDAMHDRIGPTPGGGGPADVPSRWLEPVVDALRAGDVHRTVGAARGLLGRGPGLTPAGDDALAGLFAGVLLLGPAIDDHADARSAAVGAAAGAGAAVAAAADGRTTSVSAALLAHAVRGEVAAPAARVLRALVGRGELGAAVDGLLAIGASSGHDLATGIVAAGRTVTEPSPTAAPPVPSARAPAPTLRSPAPTLRSPAPTLRTPAPTARPAGAG
jgi:hypothetical protein